MRYAPGYTGPMLPGPRPRPRGEVTTMPVMGNRGMGGKGIGMKDGGKVSSASKRADGCAQRGKTKGTMR